MLPTPPQQSLSEQAPPPRSEGAGGFQSRAFIIARRWFRIALGFTTLLFGLLLIVLPGPAVLVIPIGLAILATEYAWARRYLNKFKEGGEKLGAIFFSRRKKSDG